MPAKKTKKEDSKSSDVSWEEIGKMVGQKVEKGTKGTDWTSWGKQKFVFKEEHGGGFGRLLFAIGVMVLLTNLGIIPVLAWWMYVLIIGGFALMRF